MQLTRLDIKGFKSFGDKTTIHFNNGVTAIVGPNGCGKSNVVDAIRWVLGEQSTRNLRSEKMENVIFNGTKSRKAAQLAEVSLSFNNTNNILPTSFSQVTITRKLYRSGESEYRINDVQCRLKDITDLFLDTGVGSDSYAIIELKMVDEIINNKENSRRALFEEASGISKYKIRKKQTFNRLKETELDLSRIDDLLFEIEKNLKSLEYQAKKTERFYHLKEQYKTNGIALASIRMSGFKNDLESIKEKETIQQQQNNQINKEILNVEEAIRKLKTDLLTKESNLSTQQKALNAQSSQIQQYETEKKVKNEQLRNLNEKNESLNKDLLQDKQQYNHIQYNLTRIKEELFIETEKLSVANQNLEGKSKEVSTLNNQQKELKAELDELLNQKGIAQTKRYELEKSTAVLLIQIDALKQESQKSLSDNESHEIELSSFDKAVTEIKIRLESLQNDYDFFIKEEEALENQLTETTQRIDELNTQNNQEIRLLDARQNEYNLTKSLVDNLEGFPESIRFLKKNPKWKANIPLFSDILYCQENYRVAIENYLEPYMNYYVVDDTVDALTAIQLLNDSSKGKAGFFVLNAVKTADKEALLIDDNLIPALTIIDVEKKYLNLCKQLLKNVYFERENTTALQDHQLSDTDLVILDKHGLFIKKSYSISGGSVGLFEGKRIGRAKNLANLQTEINKLTKNQQSLESYLQLEQNKLISLKSSSRKEQLQEIKLQINQLTNELISVQTKQEQYQHFIAHNQSQKESIDQKIKEFEIELQEKKIELDGKSNAVDLFNDRIDYLQKEYASSSQLYADESALYNQQNISFHQQKNKVSGLEKDLEYREIQLENIENRINKHQEEIDKIKILLQDTVQFVDLSDVDLQTMYEQKDSLTKGLNEIEKEYYALRKDINDLEDKLIISRRNKEQTDVLLNELKDKANEIRLGLNALSERISVEFNLELEDINADQSIEGNEEELREKTTRLKKQLDDFGAINPIAMESFKEMDERYQFIKQEKNDLLDAKETLLKTIKEIDTTAQEKFMIAFNDVRENFIQVFRSLFSEEDTCDILLTNPDNPLESDIQIIARPKGKKPLSINQLSGGEKTLTATALLFSLYLSKPAPFCIFDEVDAPLDDTNIDKFNNIIRTFSKRSQFIVISHNKRTIANTDIIYGVTMIEQGISRLVAVDMQDLVVDSN
ncbi:chromosome segregation protein SMC [Albibacterium sp.]|uniref:chromosome segregation protein SMC n=1 Tax=Albibacterium sp. TaxID=2952885 RepID=UPI002B9512C6|nr:chromosome segregation protein SMC [Albibacterium sp.]HUH18646.1 chromosome segregation protein SMC [Albibacterium sp.]